MGDDIWSAVKAAAPAPGSASTDAANKAMWEAVATAIVNHLKNNMVVVVEGTVTSGAGSGGAVTAENTAGSGVS